MVVLNDFVLFLKQESGSRAQRLKAQGSREEKGIQQSVAREVEGIFELFSNSGNLVNPAKSVLNSNLYYPASSNINSYLSSFFFIFLSVVSPGGSPLKADSHEGSQIASTDTNTTSDQWSYFHKT